MTRNAVSSIVLMTLLAGAASASAQPAVNPTATTEAPAVLACGSTGSATVRLEGIPPAAAAEVVVVMDRSSSVSASDFTLEKQFVRDLLSGLPLSPDDYRAAIVTFGTQAELRAGLSGNQAFLQINVLNLFPSGGFSCVACGIQVAADHLDANARPGIPTYIIVLTDSPDRSDDAADLTAIVANAKARGHRLIAVGMEGNTDPNELAFINSAELGSPLRAAFDRLSSLLLNPLLERLAANATTDVRVVLSVGPAFAVAGATPSGPYSTVSVAGNDIEWAISSLRDPIPLTIDFTGRAGAGAGGPHYLFASTSYEDSQGHVVEIPNPVVVVEACADLREQIASLTAQVATLESQVAALKAENARLEALLAALTGATPVPTNVPGKMTGDGRIYSDGTRVTFYVDARANTDGTSSSYLRVTTCPSDEAGSCLGSPKSFRALATSTVRFANDAAFAPSADPALADIPDTLTYAGAGTFEDVDGYQYWVRATDRGDATGPNSDTFEIVIIAPDGAVVLDATGPVASGNLEAKPPR